MCLTLRVCAAFSAVLFWRSVRTTLSPLHCWAPETLHTVITTQFGLFLVTESVLSKHTNFNLSHRWQVHFFFFLWLRVTVRVQSWITEHCVMATIELIAFINVISFTCTWSNPIHLNHIAWCLSERGVVEGLVLGGKPKKPPSHRENLQPNLFPLDRKKPEAIWLAACNTQQQPFCRDVQGEMCHHP